MSPDGARSGSERAYHPWNGRGQTWGTDLAQHLAARMKPGTPTEFEDALKPDPHLYMRGDEGLFPLCEGTAFAGLQREGKTFALTGLATAQRVGVNVGGLAPTQPDLATLFVTAEDSREQMMHKIAACADAAEQRGKGAREAVRTGLIVLDLGDELFSRTRVLVEMGMYRQPRIGQVVEPLCEAIETAQRMHGVRFGMVVFETASTLNDGDESNPTLRLLADAVRRVARRCEVASVLSHHLNQAAIKNVSELNISSADLRGGTSLPANIRQNVILVSLGSDRYPFPDNDKRTLLRRIVDGASPTTERGDKVVVAVPLDASKAATPPPVYFRQYATAYGPALLPIPTPDVLAPLSWQEQVAYLRASSASEREADKAEMFNADVLAVINAVRELEAEGKPATENAVSERCGHTSDWSRSRLDRAAVEGRLHCRRQAVPRRKGTVNVYTTSRDSSASEQSPEDTR